MGIFCNSGILHGDNVMIDKEEFLNYEVAERDAEENKEAIIYWPPFQLTKEVDGFIIQWGERFDEMENGTSKAIMYMRGSDNRYYRLTVDVLSEAEPREIEFLENKIVGFDNLP